MNHIPEGQQHDNNRTYSTDNLATNQQGHSNKPTGHSTHIYEAHNTNVIETVQQASVDDLQY